MRKKIFAILMISLVFLSGCKAEEEVIPVLKAPVQGKMETAVVSRGDIFELTTYDAKVYPDLLVVYPEIDSTLEEITINLGQDVEIGDVLARLNNKQLSKQIEELEDTIEDTKANNNFNNMQQELDIQIMELNIMQKIAANASELEIAQMQAELEKLEINRRQRIKRQEFDLKKLQEKLDEVKKELESTTIKAPASGKVVYVNTFDTGVWVSKDNPFIIITDESKLHIQSKYIDKNTYIFAGEVYALINGKRYEVEYIPLEAEEIAKMEDNGIELESRFDIKGDWDGIASGDYVCICLKNKVKENVLNIPKNALYSDAEGNFVYRMNDDGTFGRCNVETGIETDIQIEITSGLEEGDVIYVQGS